MQWCMGHAHMLKVIMEPFPFLLGQTAPMRVQMAPAILILAYIGFVVVNDS